jgi:hypothetical protein
VHYYRAHEKASTVAVTDVLKKSEKSLVRIQAEKVKEDLLSEL